MLANEIGAPTAWSSRSSGAPALLGIRRLEAWASTGFRTTLLQCKLSCCEVPGHKVQWVNWSAPKSASVLKAGKCIWAGALLRAAW